MTDKTDLDRHFAETADLARGSMATVLASLHTMAQTSSPGTALNNANNLQATVTRMEEAMSSAHHFFEQDDDVSASVDCARVMALSEYAQRMAKLRTIAAQIEAYDEAHSGNAS